MDKILVVEDEKFVRESLVDLMEAEGYSCSSANNGLDALKKLKKENPDLIITDIIMPYLDGIELFNKIREIKETELIPVIFLTAKTSRESIREAMNLGADDYIIKPYSANELLNVVKIRIEKSKTLEKNLDELRLNLTKYIPHELRTPLVPILGYVDLILMDLESITKEELLHMLTMIKKSGNKLAEWVEKYIFYVELETKFIDLKRGKLVLNNNCAISEVNWKINFRKNNWWKTRESDIHVSLNAADINIKEDHLEFVIKELVENACKFSNPGTPIDIKGSEEDGYYYLIVKDKGKGFKKDQIMAIQAFSQVQREKFQQDGNGVGLAIVRKIIEMTRGKLKINSEQDKYTIVSTSFPLSN